VELDEFVYYNNLYNNNCLVYKKGDSKKEMVSVCVYYEGLTVLKFGIYFSTPVLTRYCRFIKLFRFLRKKQGSCPLIMKKDLEKVHKRKENVTKKNKSKN
jgi:hypothetical protein